MAMVDRVCPTCGSDFRVRACVLRERNFCSRACLQTRPPIPLSEVEFIDGGETALIPIHRRDGSVKAHVKVDAADAPWVCRWRWSMDARGYAVRGVSAQGGRRTFLLHRELMGLRHGDPMEVDHIDRDPSNCRRSNLRIVTHSQNLQNVPGKDGVTSQHRGVSFAASKKKWRAQVVVSGVRVFDAYFDTEESAADAAREARRKYVPYATN